MFKFPTRLTNPPFYICETFRSSSSYTLVFRHAHTWNDQLHFSLLKLQGSAVVVSDGSFFDFSTCYVPTFLLRITVGFVWECLIILQVKEGCCTDLFDGVARSIVNIFLIGSQRL